MPGLKQLLQIPLFAVIASASCPNYQNLVDRWNVIASSDVGILHGNFEGRAYAGGTATLEHFAIGEKINNQCSGEPTLSANKIVAKEGNFCGGAAESNTFENMKNTGSNLKCDWQAANSNCGLQKKAPRATVSRLIFLVISSFLG